MLFCSHRPRWHCLEIGREIDRDALIAEPGSREEVYKVDEMPGREPDLFLEFAFGRIPSVLSRNVQFPSGDLKKRSAHRSPMLFDHDHVFPDEGNDRYGPGVSDDHSFDHRTVWRRDGGTIEPEKGFFRDRSRAQGSKAAHLITS